MPDANMYLIDEIFQHRLGVFKIGDNADFHGPDRDNIPRCTTQHAFGLFANGDHQLVSFSNGDN